MRVDGCWQVSTSSFFLLYITMYDRTKHNLCHAYGSHRRLAHLAMHFQAQLP
jgi:hypothetical protein